jgi:threonine synthase
VAVREVGERTFPIVRETVDEIVRVTNDEVCAAIKDVFDDTRSVMEPAGALGVAGLKAWVAREGVRDQQLVVVLSGANSFKDASGLFLDGNFTLVRIHRPPGAFGADPPGQNAPFSVEITLRRPPEHASACGLSVRLDV